MLRLLCFASLNRHAHGFAVRFSSWLRFATSTNSHHAQTAQDDSASTPRFPRFASLSPFAKPRRFALRLCSLALFRFAPPSRTLHSHMLKDTNKNGSTLCGKCARTRSPEASGDKRNNAAAPPPAAWHPPTLTAASRWASSLARASRLAMCV